jgi:pyrimidine-specific ribonucleoside hydrolase
MPNIRRLSRRLPAGLLALCLGLAACSPPAGPPTTATPFSGAPRAVLVDTDLSADDIMALLYLLQRPDLDVRAITVSGTGHVHCAAGVANALGLVALAGHDPIPVACGSEAPLGAGHAFPADWRAAADAGYGLALASGETPVDGTAVDMLTAAMLAAPEPLLVLTLGPLTNLAQSLLAQPGLAERIGMVYVMGGAITVPGNAGPEASAAEWNIYSDPEAAQAVLAFGVPLTLVPLDATNTLPITPAYVRQITQQAVSPEAKAVAQLLAADRDFVNSGEYYFWDPLAAALLSEPSLAATRPATVRVVTSGPDTGRMVEEAGGAAVRVAAEPDPARFAELFLATLNAQQ